MDESRVKELLKLEPGLRTNHALHDLLFQHFLGYWTFLEPEHEGEEVADAVMLWGDTALLFEAKTRGVPRMPSPAWLPGKLTEAVHQLNAGAAMIRAGGVTLRNSWRGEVLIDPAKIEHIYGVVVLVTPCDSFEWRELAPDAYTDSNIPVQVFSLFDLAEVLRIFDTPNDILSYYALRERHGRNHRMLVGEEEDTFEWVLGTLERFWDGDPEEAHRIEEYWARRANAVLMTPLAEERGFQEWASSRLIDFALKLADKRADTDPSGKRVGSSDHETFVRTLEAVGEMNQLRRSRYGDMWLEAADDAVAQGSLGVRKSYSPSRSRSYILTATPLGEEPQEWQLAQMARATMHEKRTTSCLAFGASAASIRATYEFAIRCNRREKPEVPDEYLCLAPKLVWLEKN